MECNRKKWVSMMVFFFFFWEDGFFFFLSVFDIIKKEGGVNERNIWFIFLLFTLCLSFPHYIITLFYKKKEKKEKEKKNREYSSNNFWKECSESEENNIFLEILQSILLSSPCPSKQLCYPPNDVGEASPIYFEEENDISFL